NQINDIDYQDNYIIYKNILPNIDIKYDLVGKTAKETIFLNSKIDALDKINFNIETNLELVSKDNKIMALDRNGEKIYEFVPPYMIDNKQDFGSCYYNLEKVQGEYLIVLELDKEWLDKANYPVLIDPTITGENSTVYDTYIYPGDANVNRNSHEYLKVGVDSNNVKYRALVKFELPKIGTGSQVINAVAHFTSYKDDYYPAGEHLTSLNKNATVHQVTQDWTETQANWNTMNNKYSEMVEGYSEMRRGVLEYSGGTDGSITLGSNDFDITSLVKKWYSGVPNYGIMLKWANETKDASCKEYYLYSKDNKGVLINNVKEYPKPVLVIKYRNQNGKLDYMSYYTISFS
ncbi:MAG: DNRLRE domain-containing protein, partial [Bacilli bacterium]|nr:DNRLRE domain-containing protein [Bacilli bacterium]